MRATRTILMWSVVAAFGAIAGFPVTAAAQTASAQLSPQGPGCQWTLYSKTSASAYISPSIEKLRAIGPWGQFVFVRWTLWRYEFFLFGSGQYSQVAASNWWRGTATATDPKPVVWQEYALNAIGQVVPNNHQSNLEPAWGLNVPLVNRIPTKFVAQVEVRWIANIDGSPDATTKVWATNGSQEGYCYYPYPY
jgi:hypothetical protein